MRTATLFAVLTASLFSCTACFGHFNSAPGSKPDAAVMAPSAGTPAPAALPAAPPDYDATDMNRTRTLIKNRYVRGDVHEKTLFYGAVRGMVESLKDPYSEYFDPDEAKEFKEAMYGTFVGIGAELGEKNGRLTVIAPIRGSPAEKAGVRSGDVIVSIDGKNARGLKVGEAVKLIRGKDGTTVKLGLFRAGTKKRLELEIVRAEIAMETVVSKTMKVGKKEFLLVQISGFHEETPAKFRAAVAGAIFRGVDGLIVDLRGNPGGMVDSVRNIICNWDPDGPVTVMEPRGEKPHPILCEQKSSLLKDMKTAILVDGGSASASEIMTGALQDYGKARVFGEKTFGKGCGQNIIDYPDGSSLKLTTFLWKTPKGRSIDKVGLEPDETVKNSAKDDAAKRDATLQRALKWLAGKN